MAQRDTSPVVELRQYTLHPGKRDDLISLFDRHFLETQEVEGMRIIGQFRDANAPDRFVWVRGFRDMESRQKALQAFYTGPTWKTHSKAANATMIDSSDVLLLRPVTPESGFLLPDGRAWFLGATGQTAYYTPTGTTTPGAWWILKPPL